MTPESLTTCRIRQVAFDERAIDSGQCVAQRNRCVRKCARIDDNESGFPPTRVNQVYQFMLSVALTRRKQVTRIFDNATTIPLISSSVS